MSKNTRGFIIALMMVVGPIVAGWGWDKNESTDITRTKGAVVMMVAGGALFAAGFTWLIASNGFGKKGR